jgi:hypothetical protein
MPALAGYRAQIEAPPGARAYRRGQDGLIQPDFKQQNAVYCRSGGSERQQTGGRMAPHTASDRAPDRASGPTDAVNAAEYREPPHGDGPAWHLMHIPI